MFKLLNTIQGGLVGCMGDWRVVGAGGEVGRGERTQMGVGEECEVGGFG